MEVSSLHAFPLSPSGCRSNGIMGARSLALKKVSMPCSAHSLAIHRFRPLPGVFFYGKVAFFSQAQVYYHEWQKE
jgi:hypothetical protein